MPFAIDDELRHKKDGDVVTIRSEPIYCVFDTQPYYEVKRGESIEWLWENDLEPLESGESER